MDHASVRAPVCNICTGRTSSIKDLTKTLFSIVGYDVPVTYAGKKAGDIQVSLGDPQQLMSCFHMSPRYDLGSGLLEMMFERIEEYRTVV